MKKIIITLFLASFLSSANSQECLIGEVRMFAGNFAPRGWAFCDGQLLAISQHTALFSIVGTIYGGDGRTTFALPDLRGRAPVHEGSGPGLPYINLEAKGGATSFTINSSQLPPHKHTGHIKVSDAQGSLYNGNAAYFADSSKVEYRQFSTIIPNGEKKILGVETDDTGSGQTIFKRSPYTGINFIICLI